MELENRVLTRWSCGSWDGYKFYGIFGNFKSVCKFYEVLLVIFRIRNSSHGSRIVESPWYSLALLCQRSFSLVEHEDWVLIWWLCGFWGGRKFYGTFGSFTRLENRRKSEVLSRFALSMIFPTIGTWGSGSYPVFMWFFEWIEVW